MLVGRHVGRQGGRECASVGKVVVVYHLVHDSQGALVVMKTQQ